MVAVSVFFHGDVDHTINQVPVLICCTAVKTTSHMGVIVQNMSYKEEIMSNRTVISFLPVPLILLHSRVLCVSSVKSVKVKGNITVDISVGGKGGENVLL